MTAHALYKNAILRRAKFVAGFSLKDNFSKVGFNLWEHLHDCQMSS